MKGWFYTMNLSFRKTSQELFNYKLTLLIQIWQETYEKNFYTIPTHYDFFILCFTLFHKSHQYHIDLFEKYMLSGIKTGYFPDQHSKNCKDFFAPIIKLWYDVSENDKNALPTCEDILLLSEALFCSSSETQKIIFALYDFTGINNMLTKSEKNIIYQLKNRRRFHEKREVAIQYQKAKKHWKKIPFWVSIYTEILYPYC